MYVRRMGKSLDQIKKEADEAVAAFAPLKAKHDKLADDIKRLEREIDRLSEELEDFEEAEDFYEKERAVRQAVGLVADAERELIAQSIIADGGQAKVIRTIWDQDGNRIEPGQVATLDAKIVMGLLKDGAIAPR